MRRQLIFIILFAGIQYLREYLHLPQEIVPATLKRPIRAETAKPKPRGTTSIPIIHSLLLYCVSFIETDRPNRDDRDDRDQYRCKPFYLNRILFTVGVNFLLIIVCFLVGGEKKTVGAGEGFNPEFVSEFFSLFNLDVIDTCYMSCSKVIITSFSCSVQDMVVVDLVAVELNHINDKLLLKTVYYFMSLIKFINYSNSFYTIVFHASKLSWFCGTSKKLKQK